MNMYDRAACVVAFLFAITYDAPLRIIVGGLFLFGFLIFCGALAREVDLHNKRMDQLSGNPIGAGLKREMGIEL